MKVAVIGDQVTFKRENIFITGKVTTVNENSVIVEVEEDVMNQLNLPNNRTVVNHKRYSILTKAKVK